MAYTSVTFLYGLTLFSLLESAFWLVFQDPRLFDMGSVTCIYNYKNTFHYHFFLELLVFAEPYLDPCILVSAP